MEEIRIWLEKVLRWVERSGPPRIPFAGRGGRGFANPPRPHLELACLLEHGFPDLLLGERRVSFPAGHVSLHSVHHGNRSPQVHTTDAWCVFLDVADAPDFAALEQAPLFCLMPLVHREQVVGAFSRLASRCARFGDTIQPGGWRGVVSVERHQDGVVLITDGDHLAIAAQITTLTGSPPAIDELGLEDLVIGYER